LRALRPQGNSARAIVWRYVFKTKKELSLNTFKQYLGMSDISLMPSIYDDYSQRLVPGIQTIIDHLAKTRPEVLGLKPCEFIDASILRKSKPAASLKNETHTG
jgi:hypothetical protein